MKYKYLFEESIKSEDMYYCGAYLNSTADKHPLDFIHTVFLEEVFDFIRKKEGKQ
jgi:hypothetical protein